MARGRFISESVAKDMRLNSLSVEAELVYLMTIPHLDRDGLIEGDTDILHGTVCPKRRHFRDQMEYFIEEWTMVGLVTYYQSSEGPVLWFRGFAKNQMGLRYEREIPSVFPPPPGYKHTKTGMVPVTVLEVASEQVDEPPSPSDNAPQQVNDESQALPDASGAMSEPSDIAPLTRGSARLEVEVEVKDQVQDQELNEEDDAPARDPLHQAWFETYEAEMPEHLEQPIAALVVECGESATIHGIVASSQAKKRTFGFIEKCARNYIPPPPDTPVTNYTNGAYHVDLPGVHVMEPAANPHPPPPLPPPMAHDDPWAVALSELLPTLSTQAASWLKDSRLSEESELAGEAFYQVLVSHPKADMQWLTQQLERAVRHKLRTLIGKRLMVAFVHVAESEPA